MLPNVAVHGDKSLDGVVENATWTVGRMAGKHALLFQGPSDFVRVNIPQKVDDLTLIGWVYAYWPENPASSLLMSESWGEDGASCIGNC